MTIDEMINALQNAKVDGAQGQYEVVIKSGEEEKSITEMRFLRADIVYFPEHVNEANRVILKV